MRFAVLLCILIIIACFFAAFMPQEAADALVYASWWFSLLLGLLCASTLWCVFSRLRTTVGFSLPVLTSVLFHCGICVIVCGALCSRFFTVEGRIFAERGIPVDCAYADGGAKILLPFTLTLREFSLEGSFQELPYVAAEGADGSQAAYPVENGSRMEIPSPGKTVALEKIRLTADALFCELDGRPLELKRGVVEKSAVGGLSLLYILHGRRDVVSFSSEIEYADARENAGQNVRISVDPNRPARIAGYTIYQRNWIDGEPPLPVLTVKRDRGKYLSLAGALMLFAGLFMRCFTFPSKKESLYES